MSLRPVSSLALAALISLAVPSSIFTSPGSDWRMGDLFVAAWVPEMKPSLIRGEYVVFAADGTPRGEVVGTRRRGFTGGCAVEPNTGYLWTAGYDGNTLSRYEDVHNAKGQHELLQFINLRGQTFQNGKARGLVQAVAFDASGFAYVGTTNGTNRLLKFTPSGSLVDSYELPGSKGMARFDIANDQRTIFYTSGDNVVRRYDLATRSPLSDFATLIDGSLHALRLLPNEQGLLVAGSVGITRLDMSGQYVTRHWLPATQFSSLSITPDGREFWTSTALSQLYRFDIATGTVLQGPVETGVPLVDGLCMTMEYTAAEHVCRTAGLDGEPVEIACPVY
jgi:streptogramin lyase